MPSELSRIVDDNLYLGVWEGSLGVLWKCKSERQIGAGWVKEKEMGKGIWLETTTCRKAQKFYE